MNQLMLLESLMESKSACEVLIPQPPPIASPATSMDMTDGLRFGAVPRNAPRLSVTISAGSMSAFGSGNVEGQAAASRNQLSYSASTPPTATLGKQGRSTVAASLSAFVVPGSIATGGCTGETPDGGSSELVQNASGGLLDEDTRSLRGGLNRSPHSVVLGMVDGRGGNGNFADGVVAGDGERNFEAAVAVEQGLLPPRAIGQEFREGELECECKYSRQFALNHRLQAKKVLKTLAGSTLERFRVHERSGLYVYPDRDRNVFYMTLSEVCEREGTKGGWWRFACHTTLGPLVFVIVKDSG